MFVYHIDASNMIKKHVAELVLRPQAGYIYGEDGDIEKVSMKRAIALKIASMEDFVSKRAAQIVHKAVSRACPVKIKSISFDMMARVYRIHVECDDFSVFDNEMRLQFGVIASDTWMEGDIRLQHNCELHLTYVTCKNLIHLR